MNTLNKCAVNTFADKAAALRMRLSALRWSVFIILAAATTVTHANGLDAPLNLKMSMQLSESRNESDPKKRDEMQAAPAGFAAVLAGDGPSQNTGNQIKTLRAEIQKPQSETTRIAQHSQVDKIALAKVWETSFPLNWITGLGGLLLASLAAIGWLIWRRLSGLNGIEHTPCWENDVPAGAIQTSDPVSIPSPEISDDPMYLETTEQEDAAGIAPGSKVTWPADTPPTAVMENAPTLPPASPLVDSGTFDATSYAKRLDGPKVEELSGDIEEAGFWMSLHDPARAIEIMEQYDHGDRPTSPIPWLCLLDLYREVGDEQKYIALLQRFENLFNAKAPAWNDHVAVENLHRLEDYPHLTKRICDLWNTHGIIPFLESLLYDDRDSTRMGFDMPVYREIMLLIGIAYELEQGSKRFIKPPVTMSN